MKNLELKAINKIYLVINSKVHIHFESMWYNIYFKTEFA